MKRRRWWIIGFVLLSAAIIFPPKVISEYLDERRRLNEFERVLPHVKSLPNGLKYAHELPDAWGVRMNYSLTVVEGKAYGFEVSAGMSIDRNPLYFYVDERVADPDAYAKELCDEKKWRPYVKLSRHRWYLGSGQ